MFGARYWNALYFTARFFAATGGEAAPVPAAYDVGHWGYIKRKRKKFKEPHEERQERIDSLKRAFGVSDPEPVVVEAISVAVELPEYEFAIVLASIEAADELEAEEILEILELI